MANSKNGLKGCCKIQVLKTESGRLVLKVVIEVFLATTGSHMRPSFQSRTSRNFLKVPDIMA